MAQRKNGLNPEQLALRDKWLKELNEMTLLDRVKNIDENGENVRKVFEHNFRNWVFLNYYKYYEDDHPMALRASIRNNFKNGFPVYSDDHTTIPGIYTFLSDEIIEIEKDYLNQSNDIQDKKIKVYHAFLLENKSRYCNAHNLILFTSLRKSYDSLLNYVKGKVNPHMTKIKKLDEDQKELLYLIDRMFILNLVNHRERDRVKKYQGNLARAFDFEFYKNPTLYLEFPREKLKYLKTLKSWFLYQIEQRIKVLGLEEVSPEYEFIIDYANSLVPPEKKPAKVTSPVLNLFESEEKLNSPNNFPFHVFKNYQSFQFFTHWSHHFNSKAQIAFVFRMMSEVENPPLILIKDTPFREWINEHHEKIKLESHTPTLLNAKNDDRLAAYAMLKSFIFKD